MLRIEQVTGCKAAYCILFLVIVIVIIRIVQHAAWKPVACSMRSMQPCESSTSACSMHGKSSAACHLADLNLHHVQHASPTWNHEYAAMRVFNYTMQHAGKVICSMPPCRLESSPCATCQPNMESSAFPALSYIVP